MARSMLDSPYFIGSVLTLYGLAWVLKGNHNGKKEAQDYGEPPIMPEPYEFDDTSLPDMMLSYDPHTAIRPYFLKAEESPKKEDRLSDTEARHALRDLVWAGPSFVNRYGLTQAPYSFYDTTGEFREDPGHDLTFSETARLFPKKRLFAEDEEDACSICGVPESKGKLWYTGKTRGLVCQVCYDNRKWWRAESFSAEHKRRGGSGAYCVCGAPIRRKKLTNGHYISVCGRSGVRIPAGLPKKAESFAADEWRCNKCGNEWDSWIDGTEDGSCPHCGGLSGEPMDAESFAAEYTDISGTEMHDFLKSQGFRVVPHPIAKERIYEKPYGPNYVIRVYSSVVGNQSRGVGKDAIRVQPVYLDLVSGEDAYLSVHKRVHRVKGWKENLQKRIDDILKIKPQVVRDSNGKPMVLRKARRGATKGSWFWGSRDYPRNKETKRYVNPLS